MMFVGTIPREIIQQMLRIGSFEGVEDVYVCCSGTFRFEQVLRQQHPSIRVHSNDVSLLSVSLGRALRGEPLDFRFINDLDWLEDTLGPDASAARRLAAIGYAIELFTFKGASVFARDHFNHWLTNAPSYLDAGEAKILSYLERARPHSFFEGDFRDHALAAAGNPRALVFGFPPTYKSGYERFYAKLHANTHQERPAPYRLFDPNDLPAWIDTLERDDTRYVVYADQRLADRAPVALFRSGRAKDVYLYSNATVTSSYARSTSCSKPFKYEPVNAAELTIDSRIEVRAVPAPQMNFVKDRYLKLGLVHADGNARYLVFLDGKLAGGFIHASMTHGPASFGDPRIDKGHTLYILCDFSCSRDRKLSKLIAMLASGVEQTRILDRKLVRRTQNVLTTAFSRSPVSMKYRGIYELLTRKDVDAPGASGDAAFKLNYFSEVRHGSNVDIYRDWFARYAGNPRRAAAAE